MFSLHLHTYSRGLIEGHRERDIGERGVKAAGVDSESDTTDVVESVPQQHVLHVQRRGVRVRRVEDGQKAVGDRILDGDEHEIPQTACGELERGRLALRVPRGAVRVEDAMAEKVAEALLNQGTRIQRNRQVIDGKVPTRSAILHNLQTLQELEKLKWSRVTTAV